MLNRKIGAFVKINLFYNTSGTIVDTKETESTDMDKRYDYKISWNQKMENGCGTYAYYNENELHYLELNWNREEKIQNKIIS